MSREQELEERSRIALEAAKFAEKSRRRDILTPDNPEFRELEKRFPNFTESLPSVPLDWRVSLRDYGASFLRDYPYDTPLYTISGWDACRLVTDIDLDNRTAALRLHALDGDANLTVEEGMLLRDGLVMAMNDGRFDIPSGPFRMSFWLAVQRASGDISDPESLRCLFDYFTEDLSLLPQLPEICGESFGHFATSAHYGFKDGRMIPGEMPTLAVGWPMQEGHYLVQ